MMNEQNVFEQWSEEELSKPMRPPVGIIGDRMTNLHELQRSDALCPCLWNGQKICLLHCRAGDLACP